MKFSLYVMNSNCAVHYHSHSLAKILLCQVSVGKEKEAVADMLPYLRLGYVSDPSEMQSVISSQGPICPVSFSCSITYYDDKVLVGKNCTFFVFTWWEW